MIRISTLTYAAAALAAPLFAAPARADNWHIIYTFTDPSYYSTLPTGPTSLYGRNGMLYGTTAEGGANHGGLLFEITPEGAETTLYSMPPFTGKQTGATSALPVLGNYYITSNRDIFTVNAQGVQTGVFKPAGTTAQAFSQLIKYGDMLAGYAYTGSYANGPGNGEVFTLRKSGSTYIYNTLYTFQGGTADGSMPGNSLVNVNGTLYGTTYYGGAYGGGVFFSISHTGVETVLRSFKVAQGSSTGGDNTGGSGGASQLIYVNGYFYCTRISGSKSGLLVRLDRAGNATIIHVFDHAEGAPLNSLTYANGTFYGVTNRMYFSIGLTGELTVLRRVPDTYDEEVTSNLVYLGGALYGIGFSNTIEGYIFKIRP